MGSVFESSTPVEIGANVIGTGDIAQIDVIKDNAIVQTYHPNKAVTEIKYIDRDYSEKSSYYYLRVIQKDGEMAWSSPIWVTYQSQDFDHKHFKLQFALALVFIAAHVVFSADLEL